ncbi:MAG: Ig-like domain-containing protein [Gemmatimonadales bacterium]|jgi:hypothetical protein
MRKHLPWLASLLVLTGCEERDRLTFPSNEPGGDDLGPVTVIDSPSEDTTLTEGGPFVLSGRSLDATGIDTVYFDVAGGGVNFSPLSGGGQDTVRFGLLISTLGNRGQTITVTAHAVDLHDNQGGVAIRRLTIE